MLLSYWHAIAIVLPALPDEYKVSARRQPTPRPSQSTWTVTVSPPVKAATVHVHLRHLLLLLDIQLES